VKSGRTRKHLDGKDEVINSVAREDAMNNAKKVMGATVFIATGLFLASCGANKKLVMENQDLSAGLRSSNARNEELEAKLAETQKALETAEGTLETRERELADRGRELDDANAQVDDLQTRLGDVRESLQKSFAETDSLERSIQELQETLQASESEKTRQIARLSSRKQELEKQAIDLRSELSRASKRGDDLDLQVSGLEAEVRELKGERTTLLRTISDLNSTFKARTDDLSAQVAHLMKKNEDLTLALDAASRRNERQGETLDAYSRTIADQISEFEALAKRLEALEAEKRDLEYKISAIEQDRSMLIEEEELEKQRIKSTYEKLLASLKGEIDEKTIEIQNFKNALTINMMDKIFFDSGKAGIKPEGLGVLDRIAPILENLEGKNIRIEGHTDDVPIGANSKSKYPSNWELGAARSSAVARYFVEKHGIDPARISSVSYSYYRPIVPNDSEENRARNRRIEIVLIDKSLYERMEAPGNP
jgi:chemotaxis protein MotB